MTKRALMGLILPAIIGASAAFAQQPTLNKLNLTPIKGGTEYQASALNNISGAVVIPATHNGKPVTDIGNFQADITSVIIPDGVQITGWGFGNCKNLISVNFQGSNITVRKDRIPSAFPGDLLIAYQANGTGTYTRPAGGKNWTKQGGATTPAQQPAAQYPSAQQPTLNKLNLTPIKGGTEYQASALNNISGAVVIPPTHNGKPVTDIGNFQVDITSVIIPDGVQITGWGFGNCKNLTSVTFQGSNITARKDRIPSAFPGDLLIAYQAGGAGTYTRPAGGKNWTKAQ